jgi:hypothetical protein
LLAAAATVLSLFVDSFKLLDFNGDILLLSSFLIGIDDVLLIELS